MTIQPATKLGRRTTIAGLIAAAGMRRAMATGVAPEDGGQAAWQQFRTRFVSPEGRVIDTDNGGVSHSEGQGYGLVFAEHFDDLPTFERILDWTCRSLARRSDALHAWRYIPNAAVPVADLNNASDGDLFMAYALSRASRRWNRPDFRIVASDIATDILRLLVRRVAGRTVLMPGHAGFDMGDAVVVNPSYYAFSAFDELNRVAPSPLWGALTRDGLSLLDNARFGRWKLPPDWLCITKSDGGMAPAANRPARFSWDAVRVPLNLAWGGQGGSAAAQSIASFWASSVSGQMPAWIDLVSNETSPYAASAGVIAVRDFALAAAHRPAPAPSARAPLPTNYYAAALMLLVDVGRTCAGAEAGGSGSMPMLSAIPGGPPPRGRI